MPRALALLLFALPLAARAESRAVVLVTEPAALRIVEAAGYGLAERLGAPRGAANDVLVRNAAYRSVVHELGRDLAGIRAADPKLDTGLKTSHRLFDARWLGSPKTRFELVGVVNRLDRKPFAVPDVSGPRAVCGEVRLVYRLRYATRLPMTVNLVHWVPGPDCRAAASRWIAPAAAGEALGRWLVSKEGPLAPGLISGSDLKSLEVNLQSVRWPSTVRPDMAGHAEYLLRVFRRVPGRSELEPAPLENQPDVDRIRRDPRLGAELSTWLRDPANRSAVDQGTAVLPEKFLARRAVSVAPLGLARLANRPFRRLFAKAGFPAAFLRRLDGLSCTGCHQSRSVAGFHLIGADDPGAGGSNHIAVAASPHLVEDLDRRTRYTAALARGSAPNELRPLPERGRGGPGGYGEHCGLGDRGFAEWTCRPGLTCTKAADPEVGECLPPGDPGLGDPCETGTGAPHEDPHRDRVKLAAARTCAGEGSYCQSNRAGFPGGLCAQGCEGLPAAAVCGGIPVLRTFNDCLAKRRPFEECIATTARPNALRACSETEACRDDYICARTASGRGACLPPYFLFQMRVDGHAVE